MQLTCNDNTKDKRKLQLFEQAIWRNSYLGTTPHRSDPVQISRNLNKREIALKNQIIVSVIQSTNCSDPPSKKRKDYTFVTFPKRLCSVLYVIVSSEAGRSYVAAASQGKLLYT